VDRQREVSSKMRNLLIAAALLVCAAPASARAQSANFSVQGFGGLTFSDSSFIGGTQTASNFGGLVTAAITPNVLAIGEFGRLSDIKSSIFGEVLEYTPADLRVSAWYGQGGVRFIASRSVVRPYGEATAGFARLSTGISGLGDTVGFLVDAALPYLNQTEPMLGLGGGVLLTHGPLAIDVGYRYKKIHTSGISSAFSLSDGFHVNEIRFGAGIRF
jgi:opacity protein-like surface antigen